MGSYLGVAVGCPVPCFHHKREVGLSFTPKQNLGGAMRAVSRRRAVRIRELLSSHQEIPTSHPFLSPEARRPTSVSWSVGVALSDLILGVRN